MTDERLEAIEQEIREVVELGDRCQECGFDIDSAIALVHEVRRLRAEVDWKTMEWEARMG
jgi:hypothetical protein